MTFAVLDILNIISFSVSWTIVILLLSRVRKNISYLFLAAFVFALVSGTSIPVLNRYGFYETYPSLIYFPTHLNIFSLPFLYTFVIYLSGELSWKKVRWAFVIPILAVITQLYYWYLPNTEKLLQLTNGQWQVTHYRYRVIDFIHALVLIGFILKAIRKYEDNVDQFYSEGLPQGFAWVKTLCYFILLILIPLMIPISAYPKGTVLFIAATFTCLAILLVIWVGIEGMNQKFMYLDYQGTEPHEKEVIHSEVPAFTDSNEVNFESSDLLKRLVAEIHEKQLYRSVSLNLEQLAQSLQISPRKLSTVINQESGKNFRNFINGFRIDYARRQLKSGILESINMNGLAQESGFKSRTTFYAAFKSETGSTPLEYLKLQQPPKDENEL